MKKLPPLAILVVTLALVSAGTVTRSSDLAPSGVIYFDLAVDDSRQLVYGSDQEGGSLHALSMATLDVVSTLSVGAGPAGLDISPDGSELAVALHGQGEIAFVSLDTFSVISRTVPAGVDGPNQPYDLLYGRPGRLYSVGNPIAGTYDYVHVFDTNTKLEVGRSSEAMHAAPRLAMTADQNTLYVSQVSLTPNQIFRFDIRTDTPAQTAETPHGPASVNTLCIVSDKIYTSSGQVWSADLMTLLGTFTLNGSEIECAETLQKVFVSTGESVLGFDAVDLSKLLEVGLPPPVRVARLDGAEEKLYVSTSDGIKVLPANMEPRAYLALVAGGYCGDFVDDFSSPISGWPVVDNDHVRTQYLDGEYRILSKEDGYLYLFGSPACEHEHYSVEVDVRWEGKQGNSYGLIFGIQGDYTDYYLFDVNTDYQAFRLYRRSPSGFSQIVGATPSGAIRAGKSSNRLGVTRDGSKIALYANGTALGTWWDGGITGMGGVGIVTSPYDGRPTSDARFDNFGVVSLPTDGTSAKSTDSTGAERYEPRALESEIDPLPLDLGW